MRRKIELRVMAECVRDDETGKSIMHLKYDSNHVTNDAGDVDLGSIGSCVNGGIELEDKETNDKKEWGDGVFYIGLESLWDAFQKALGKDA